MIVVDASALCAVLLGEDDAQACEDLLVAAVGALISPVQAWEAAVAISTRLGPDGESMVELALGRLGIEIAPIGAAESALAFDAWRRYGKGRHPAGLNLGDCFAYALARSRDLPLLYKGVDFSKTDARAAV